MAYTPKTWTTGETITAAELNALEQGASAAAATADTANTGLSSKVNSSTYTAGLAAKADLPAGGTDGQALVKAGATTAWATVAGGTTPDATTTTKGAVQLAGDLAGTAAAPTVAKIGGVAPATVATSGSYSDLSNKPVIPTVGAAGTAGAALSATDATTTNPRTPTAHASTHASGGSDPVTPAAIGADAAGAASTAQAFAIQRANHTGTQSADTLTDGTTNKAFLATERTKLTGVAAGATANSTDAQLRDRSTHTGTQAASTITGLATVATTGAYTDLTATPTIPTVGAAGAGATVALSSTDASVTNARTPTAHTHPASDLTATGTRDATTFLRGDNTWVAPAGGANATTTAPGLVQLAGDLGGTAAVPLVKYNHALTAYGLTDTAFAKWRLAYATARAGGAPAKVLCLGDSITAGGTTLNGDIWGISWPGRMRSFLDARTGAAGNTGIFFPTPTAPSANSQGFRPSIASIGISSTGAGWNEFDGVGSYGLLGLYYTSTVGSTYTVTWTGPQTLRVHTGRGVGATGASVTSTLDGSASTAISNTGTGPIATDYTPSGSGAHTLVLTVVACQLNLIALELRNATGGVVVHNAGNPGKKTTDFIGTTPAAASAVSHAALIAPDLTVIFLGTNDMNAAVVPVSTFKTNMQTLITNAKNTGDVVLVTPPRNNASAASPNSYADYCAALYQLSDTNNVPVVDLRNRYAANPDAWMDPIGHAAVAGTYVDMGAAAFNLATAHTY